MSHIQPLTQTKPSRQIISTWGSSTGLTLLKSGSSWSHILQSSALPRAAAAKAVALALSNCDNTHHQGYESWLSVTWFPHSSSLNEFSSSQQPPDPSEGVVPGWKAPCFLGPLLEELQGHQVSPEEATTLSLFPSCSLRGDSFQFLRGFCFVLQSKNLTAEFATRQWCWHLWVHICR